MEPRVLLDLNKKALTRPDSRNSTRTTQLRGSESISETNEIGILQDTSFS